MAAPVSMKTLLEAGVHFGHQTRRWDPKMKPFIFTERNGIHIIDLQQTVGRLGEAMGYVRDLASSGGSVMFIGTKKQAQETIEQEAARCNMPYVNQRWMGGMMTNFTTIQTRIKRLQDLEARQAQGEFERLPKKEANNLIEEMERLTRLLGGMRNLTRLPDAVFVVDPHREALAIAEARRLSLPIVAMVDTNCNPDVIDYPIPSNDDAIRAIRLLASKIADAVLEGVQQRESEMAKAEAEAEAEISAIDLEEEAEEKTAAVVTLEEMEARATPEASVSVDGEAGVEPAVTAEEPAAAETEAAPDGADVAAVATPAEAEAAVAVEGDAESTEEETKEEEK